MDVHGVSSQIQNSLHNASLVDITVYHGGFHGDLNETMFVGKVDEGSRRLVQTAYECMMKGINIGTYMYVGTDIVPAGIRTEDYLFCVESLNLIAGRRANSVALLRLLCSVYICCICLHCVVSLSLFVFTFRSRCLCLPPSEAR